MANSLTLSFNAAPVVKGNGNALRAVGHGLHHRVQQKTGIVLLEVRVCLADDEGVETPLVDDEVVLVAPLVEGQVITRNAIQETGLLRRVGRLPVPVPPLECLGVHVLLRFPSRDAVRSAHASILQVLGDEVPRILLGDAVRGIHVVEERAEVSGAPFVVGQDGAVVRVRVLHLVLLRQRPDGVLRTAWRAQALHPVGAELDRVGRAIGLLAEVGVLDSATNVVIALHNEEICDGGVGEGLRGRDAGDPSAEDGNLSLTALGRLAVGDWDSGHVGGAQGTVGREEALRGGSHLEVDSRVIWTNSLGTSSAASVDSSKSYSSKDRRELDAHRPTYIYTHMRMQVLRD